VVPSAGDNIIIRNDVEVTIASSLDLGQFGTLELQGSGKINTTAAVAVIPRGWEIFFNFGPVLYNYGKIWENYEELTYNYGIIVKNIATVTYNHDTVMLNGDVIGTNYAQVWKNIGTIGINSNLVWINEGTITTDNGVSNVVAAGVAEIKAKTDQLAFSNGRVKATSPSGGGIGGNSFQFELTAAAADPKVLSPESGGVVDEQVLDATKRTESFTDATIGTQWQITIVEKQPEPGEGGNPWVEFSSSNDAVATVNSEGLVEYVGDGTCSVYGTSKVTVNSPSQTRKVEITNSTTSGGTTSTTEYIPDDFDAAKHVLILYNSDVAESGTLKDYYLANRPGMATANVLGLTGLADATSVSSSNVTTLILDPVYDWLVANEAAKPIRYIVAMRGVPSRQGASGSVGYMLYDLLNARGYRESEDGYKGGESRFCRAQYQGATCLPTWIDMGSYAASTAYIDKLAAAVAGLQADGVTIDGSVAGVAGDQWLFDEKRSLTSYSDQYADDAAQVVVEGIDAGDVIYQSNKLGPAIATAVDLLFSGGWGFYAWGENLPDDVTFSGLAGWWLMNAVQSYGGIYEGYGGTWDYMPDPTEIFAADAFGGADYSNTPVGYVGFTAEPYLSGVQTRHYPGRWARGWTFAEAAWVGRNSPHMLAVGDPLVTR
jgi:hypothetical protein